MLILIVEDTIYRRRILESVLLESNHDVIVASNGIEAVSTFEERQPDMVLMDVVLPGMDGYVATAQIKKASADRFVPVIFVTSLTGTDVLEKCIECGGDDIISGTYDQHTLLAKIASMERIKKLHEKLKEQTTELRKHKVQAQRELDIAEHVFSTILNRGDVESANINYNLSPMSLFSGDILLAAHTPAGGLHVMLGDFTGHGLSAAIGAMPTSDIFYAMTASGFSTTDIITEINRRLHKVLPTGMFCAAIFLELDPERSTLTVWNGGMPDVLITGEDGNIECAIDSTHQALGIRSEFKFDSKTAIVPIDEHNKIYIYSDGLIEAKNRRGRKFGSKALKSMFPQAALSDPPLHDLLDELEVYTIGVEQSDDISIVEVNTLRDDKWRADQGTKDKNRKLPSSWKLSLKLEADTLRSINPVPLLLNMVMGVQSPQGHRERIFTILSELFSNALDHGLLGIDSSLKSNAAGFAEYYRLRGERLGVLENGVIEISLDHLPDDKHESGALTILVTDSGPGFDCHEHIENLDSNEGYSGRGIGLVKSLCQSLEYCGNGNQVKAVYEWNKE